MPASFSSCRRFLHLEAGCLDILLGYSQCWYLLATVDHELVRLRLFRCLYEGSHLFGCCHFQNIDEVDSGALPVYELPPLFGVVVGEVVSHPSCQAKKPCICFCAVAAFVLKRVRM
jgi:hypothetical protein